MHIYVQWATNPCSEFVLYETAREVNRLPPKPLPPRGHTQGNILVRFNERPGWIHGVNIQGVVFEVFDHYAFSDLSNGGVRVVSWNDDDEDWGDRRYALQMDFNPIRIDPQLGVLNTHQVQTRWSTADEKARRTNAGKLRFDFPWLDWSEFQQPRGKIFHGIWMSDRDHVEQRRLRTRHSWREWKQ